jgi:hypothetical protein
MARDPHAPEIAQRDAPTNGGSGRVVAFISPSIQGLEQVTGTPIGRLKDLARDGRIDIWQGRGGVAPYVITGPSGRR